MTERTHDWKVIELIKLGRGAEAMLEGKMDGEPIHDFRIRVTNERTGASVVITSMQFRDAASRRYVWRSWRELKDAITL